MFMTMTAMSSSPRCASRREVAHPARLGVQIGLGKASAGSAWVVRPASPARPPQRPRRSAALPANIGARPGGARVDQRHATRGDGARLRQPRRTIRLCPGARGSATSRSSTRSPRPSLPNARTRGLLAVRDQAARPSSCRDTHRGPRDALAHRAVRLGVVHRRDTSLDIPCGLALLAREVVGTLGCVQQRCTR